MHDLASYNWCIIHLNPYTLSPPHITLIFTGGEELIARIPARGILCAVAASKSHFFVAWLETAVISVKGLVLVPSVL